MIDKIFIDTNILVYLFDKTEKIKQDDLKRTIAEYISTSKIFISTQVVNEFINIVSRKIASPLPSDKQKEIIEFLNDVFTVVPLYLETTFSAIEIRDRYKLSFWDSLIISSALENKCNILLSEDMQNEFVVEEKLEIRNPFIK